MTDKNTELDQQQEFDPLDMNNYKVEKLPKMQKSGFEKWMARLGMPLAILSFVLFLCVFKIPFIDNLENVDLRKGAESSFTLSEKGQKSYDGIVKKHKEELTAELSAELPAETVSEISAKAQTMATEDFIDNNYAMLVSSLLRSSCGSLRLFRVI